MISVDKLKTQLERLYKRDAGFFTLVNRKSYPYEVSLKPPASSVMLNDPVGVKKWQDSFIKSDFAPFLIWEKRRTRNALGQQMVLTKIRFDTRDHFEHFIAPDLCDSPYAARDAREDAAREEVQRLVSQPQVQTLADKFYHNREALTDSERFAVRIEPLFAYMHTVPVAGADPSVKGTIEPAGLDRLLEPAEPKEQPEQSQVQYEPFHWDVHCVAGYSPYDEDADKKSRKEPELPVNSDSLTDADFENGFITFANPLAIKSIPGSFRAFDEICALVCNPLYPALKSNSPEFELRLRGVRSFMRRYARKVAEMGSDFILAVQFVDYMAALGHAPDIYYRQLALPHMDTKFIERQYRMLNDLLCLCLPRERQLDFVAAPAPASALPPSERFIAAVSGSEPNTADLSDESMDAAVSSLDDRAESNELSELDDSDDFYAADFTQRGFKLFLRRWGFRNKPHLIRFRFLDPELKLPGFSDENGACSDMTLDFDSLSHMDIPFKHVIICENETTFLCLPHISRTIAIFGSGYRAVKLGKLPFIQKCDVIYWGDIDTFGFAILNSLRQSVIREIAQQAPKGAESCNSNMPVRSILMNRRTLGRNSDWIVQENRQRVSTFKYLTREEFICYEDLISQKFGKNIRLEQELIPFDQVISALSQALPDEQITIPDHIK